MKPTRALTEISSLQIYAVIAALSQQGDLVLKASSTVVRCRARTTCPSGAERAFRARWRCRLAGDAGRFVVSAAGTAVCQYAPAGVRPCVCLIYHRRSQQKEARTPNRRFLPSLFPPRRVSHLRAWPATSCIDPERAAAAAVRATGKPLATPSQAASDAAARSLFPLRPTRPAGVCRRPSVPSSSVHL